MKRPSRPEILVPQHVAYSAPGSLHRADGWIVRISIVGADIETLDPPRIGEHRDIYARLHDIDVVLPGRVQWSGRNQFGVQFGALGARETHAILEAGVSGGVAWEAVVKSVAEWHAYRRVA